MTSRQRREWDRELGLGRPTRVSTRGSPERRWRNHERLDRAAARVSRRTVAGAQEKESWLKRIFKLFFVLFVLLAVLIVFLPTLLTKFVLKGQVKSQLAKQTGGGDVSRVELGWSTGLLVDGLTIPSAAPWAKRKDIPAVKLDHFAAKLSVPAAIKAAATGGEVLTTLEAQKATIYLELHPGGKTNIALPEPAPGAQPATTAPADSGPGNGKTADGKPAEAKPLPCTAKAILDCKEFDIEVADCTSSTGAIQRTVLKGFKFGVEADVAKDMTTQVTALKDAPAPVSSGAAGSPRAMSFDTLKITLEQPGKPDKLVIAMDQFALDLSATYHGPRSPTADLAPMPALVAVHQVDAKPVVTIARVWSDDFDMNALTVATTIETPGAGQKVLRMLIDGVLKGQHQGKVHLVVTCDLCGKTRLPVNVDVNLENVDISGSVAKYAPTLLPVLGGATNQTGSQGLPPLTLATKADVSCAFENGVFQQDPTLKSVKDDGNLKLGPGNFEGSKMLQGFLEGFDKMDLKDIATKAMGESPFKFDGLEQVFNVKDGTINIPKLALDRQNGSLLMDGTCTFAGDYKFGMHVDQDSLKRLEPDVAKLMACVDKAGGVMIEGKVGGEYTVTTPPADKLARAMIDGGAWDVFKARNPKGAEKLNKALGKDGTNVDQMMNDPSKGGKAAGQSAADKAAESKAGSKIEKKAGISSEDAKKKISGLFGGGDAEKPDDKKPDDTKKPDDKKDDSTPSLPFKNPFGGGN